MPNETRRFKESPFAKKNRWKKTFWVQKLMRTSSKNLVNTLDLSYVTQINAMFCVHFCSKDFLVSNSVVSFSLGHWSWFMDVLLRKKKEGKEPLWLLFTWAPMPKLFSPLKMLHVTERTGTNIFFTRANYFLADCGIYTRGIVCDTKILCFLSSRILCLWDGSLKLLLDTIFLCALFFFLFLFLSRRKRDLKG